MSPQAASSKHVPVLLERCIELLRPAFDADASTAADYPRYLIDATLGMAGHAEAVLTNFPSARLVGIDRDPEALQLAGERLAQFADRFTSVHGVYDEIPEIVAELDVPRVHGVLFDLGVSSLQLDETDRGFAYSFDAPLDMRMDSGDTRTAADVVNTYPVADLTRIFKDYGEERFAVRIARAIDARRGSEPFTRSADLVDTIRGALPAAARHAPGHPGKRVFQALRIEVNGELDVLRRAIPAALDALAPSGRIVVLSYHSLEDRIVKRALADVTADKTPIDLPELLPGDSPTFRLLVRGSEQATDDEIAVNPRAKSVRLRAAERIREVA
ncbi:16S rRNA (cytosine(1402)-N(4))-methyltransferase RsmH [Spelaeicoccus albus]|uniref:Ribosomal RNA small subunit methyltransferase H n=1 Tax=Spelaeicoccus albus TaxID=1280376 RepID=A0A7Z0D506_9MICO|nr:16S rRNA (cytosine(1402)-N(4))-methyltransferase RsmH [Spelaeicoccus albus]NYI68998.1 16S rRNA (cytosine1402-N4)-methyltransferase [Spelaeicoccus albus]